MNNPTNHQQKFIHNVAKDNLEKAIIKSLDYSYISEEDCNIWPWWLSVLFWSLLLGVWGVVVWLFITQSI